MEKTGHSTKDPLIIHTVSRVLKLESSANAASVPLSSQRSVTSVILRALQVPPHLQNSWESYYMEILMVTGLLAYIMNYMIGKNKNGRLAQAWFSSHRELLESNFALVGESWTTPINPQRRKIRRGSL